MKQAFKVGPIVVEPGTKAFIEFPVAPSPDGKTVGIPLIIVNGLKEGATLLAAGGEHPDEFEGIRAIQDVGQELEPEKLSGTFMGAPVLNVPACIAKISHDVSSMRESPIDFKNLGTVAPGNAGGTVTERISDAFYNELLVKADYAMNLHAGGDRGTSVPLAGYYDVEGDFGKASYEMARLFPIELLWQLRKGTAFEAAYERGVPLIYAELNGEGRARSQDVQIYVTGIKNVMKHLGMLEGTIEGVPEKRRIIEPETYLDSKGSGFLRPVVETGQLVSEGQFLGELLDIYGRKVEEIRVPFDGIVTGIRTKPVAWPNERLFLVSRFVEGTYWP
jgi:predicted deacylase